MGILDREPGPRVREGDSPEQKQKRAQDHENTTESPRWGPGGNSEKERGYPREGVPEPERGHDVTNRPKPEVVKRPED